jgi:hypothetical protein
MAAALESIQNSDILASGSGRKHKPFRQGTRIKLNTAQELAAISSFLASLPQNLIPPSVDPSVPIDPQLVLDFDTHSPRAADEVQAMVDDVWLQNPVFLYSKVCHFIHPFRFGSYSFIALLLRIPGDQSYPCRYASQTCTHNH